MYQMLVKSQPGLMSPLALVAEVKLASVCICAVVMPVPPADVVSPEVVRFQKLLLTVAEFVVASDQPADVAGSAHAARGVAGAHRSGVDPHQTADVAQNRSRCP